MDKRYFYISYVHTNGVGCIDISTNNGNYVNLKNLVKYLEKDIKGVVIMNIIEMTFLDYKCLTGKDFNFEIIQNSKQNEKER